MTMGLREDALNAAQAAKASREQAARTVLAAALAPTDVSVMEVVAELDTRLVFCAEEVCLSVRDDAAPGGAASVQLVREDPPGWTFLGDVVSLAVLGRLLEQQQQQQGGV